MSPPSRSTAPQFTLVAIAGPRTLVLNHRFLSSDCGRGQWEIRQRRWGKPSAPPAGLRCESVGSVWDKTALISKATNCSVINNRGPGDACRLGAKRRNIAHGGTGRETEDEAGPVLLSRALLLPVPPFKTFSLLLPLTRHLQGHKAHILLCLHVVNAQSQAEAHRAGPESLL